MNIAQVSVQRPVMVSMFFLGVALIGILSLSRMPVELMPDTSQGSITIFVGVRGGLSPVEVENMVTKIIEEAVFSVSNVTKMMSVSKEGESSITLDFSPGTNMDFAALEVREKFSRIQNKLPKEIERPTIAKYQESDAPVIILAFSSVRRTPEMLRRLIDDGIKEQFARVEGVANIDVSGGRERKIIFEVSQTKMRQFGVNINQIVNMVGANNLNLLVGDVKYENNKYMIRAIGEFENVQEIRDLAVTKTDQGTHIRVKDIGTVKDYFMDHKGHARLNKRPVVSLYILKENSANTIKTVKGVLKTVDKVKKKLPSDIAVKVISNQARQIESAISTVFNALLLGALLAVFILWVFLRDIAATLIISSSIPTSVLATFILMRTFDLSLNVMTLSGLALGIGMLVDSAIVVLENTFKFRENGLSIERSAIIGVKEVALSIISSTLTTIIVFLPIVFVNETIRLQYEGLALTVTFALLSSLVVSLTLVPMAYVRLSYLFQKDKKKIATSKRKKSWFLKKIHRFYRRFLAGFIFYRYMVAMSLFVCVGVCLHHLKKIDKDFSMGGESNKFTIFIELPSGAKLEKSDETVKIVEDYLSKLPEVENYSSRIEGWSSKVYVTLVDQSLRDKTVVAMIDQIRERFQHLKDVFIHFQRDSEAQKKEIHLDLYGDDYSVLKGFVNSIISKMGTIKEFKDIKYQLQEGRPEVHIRVKKDLLQFYGLTTKAVADVVHAKMRGLRASTYRTEGKEVEIIARLLEHERKTVEDVKNLTIPRQGKTPISLRQIADFIHSQGPSEVYRKNKSRMIQISANRELSLARSVEKLEIIMSNFTFPADYYYKHDDKYETYQENNRQLLIALILTLCLIYLVLGSLFESYLQPGIILVSVPIAFIGVVTFFRWNSLTLTMGAMIGGIMLGGIVVNNAIILVDTINNSVRNDNWSVIRAIIFSGISRLRPIAMTTLTSILGLVPMALDKSESSQLWSPLAIAVISGLVTSTLFIPFFIASFYKIWDDSQHYPRYVKNFCLWLWRLILKVIKWIRFGIKKLLTKES